MRQRGRGAVEHQIDTPADHVGDGRHAALVGHMRHGRTGEVLEQFASQVQCAAHAHRGIAQRLALVLHTGDQVVEVADGRGRGDHRNQRDVAGEPDDVQLALGAV